MEKNYYSETKRLFRAVKACALSSNMEEAIARIERTCGEDAHRVKAAVGGFTGSQVGLNTSATSQYMAEVVYSGIFGAMRQDMWRVGFREAYNSALALSAHWVAERNPIPITKSVLSDSFLPVRKVSSISVHTKESLRQVNSAEATERAHRTELRHAYESAFLDPANVGFGEEIPASVSATPGVITLSAGSDPSNDMKDLLRGFLNLESSYLITDPETAVRLSLTTVNGASVFPDASVRGGSIVGLPLLVTQSMPADSTGGNVMLLDASRVVYAMDALEISFSDDATVEMQDEFDSNGGTEFVGLFQTEAIAMKSKQYLNWELLDATGCRILTGCDW